MKKFEEMEKLKKEIAEQKEKEKEKNNDGNNDENNKSNNGDEDLEFTEEQYEELFKRTASFTPETLDADIAHMEDWEFYDPFFDEDYEEK